MVLWHTTTAADHCRPRTCAAASNRAQTPACCVALPKRPLPPSWLHSQHASGILSPLHSYKCWLCSLFTSAWSALTLHPPPHPLPAAAGQGSPAPFSCQPAACAHHETCVQQMKEQGSCQYHTCADSLVLLLSTPCRYGGAEKAHNTVDKADRLLPQRAAGCLLAVSPAVQALQLQFTLIVLMWPHRRLAAPHAG